MRGEEFSKLVGSLKRSEMQVGSSIPKTVVKSEKTEENKAIKFVKHVNSEVHNRHMIL